MTLLLITTSTALNVLVLNVVNRDTPVPHWVKVVFLQYTARIVAPSYHRKYLSLNESPKTVPRDPSEKPLIQSNSTTYEADLDMQMQNSLPQMVASTHVNNDTNKSDIKVFHYIPNGSPQFYVTHNGVSSVASSATKYDQINATETFQAEQMPNPNFLHAHSFKYNDHCSYRLANQNTSSATRYGVADSPIKELVSNLKTAKLDDNGKLLAEMKLHLSEIRRTLCKISGLMNEKSDEENVRNDWLDVGVVLDRILVILFTIFTVMMTTCVYSMYPSQLVQSFTNTDEP